VFEAKLNGTEFFKIKFLLVSITFEVAEGIKVNKEAEKIDARMALFTH
jgi:hypothetical protein